MSNVLPRLAATALLAGALAAPLRAQQATSGQSRPIDPANLDTTCAACRDFYQYANGGWLTRSEIPAAYSVWGSFNELSDENNEVVRSVLEDAAKAVATKQAKPGTDRYKIGAFYASCMDSTAIEAAGAKPLRPVLDRIAAIGTRAELARTLGDLHGEAGIEPFRFSVRPDQKASSQNLALLGQGGLGLPDRDYYTRTGERAAELREAYVEHLTKLFQLLGEPAAQAAADAKTSMAIETKLAEASMTRVQQRDPNAVYHKISADSLRALAPNFDWNAYFTASGAKGVDSVNVRQPDFFRALSAMLDSVPLADWKTYLRAQAVADAAPSLSSAFANEAFAFERNFTGATEQLPRWRRCLQATNGALGEAVGAEYVKRAFPPEAKKRALEMVQNLQAALRDRLGTLSWMSDSTKVQALAKLDAFTKKIGYPDKWKDYSALKVTPDSYFTNRMRAGAWAAAENLGKLGEPVDRTEWGMTPPTVNAYYNPSYNEIVFPAGILQPPFFDPNADDAVNYGAMGAVIGHEMTHGFDDQGRQFDAEGNLRDWWTEADADAYEARAQRVVDQFNGYTVVDTATHVNGKLTLGENIADLGGLTIAYAALQKSLEGKPRTKIDGFTPEQRFFLSWAQVWRQLARPEYLRTLVQTNPHSPGRWRVNGPLSNMPAFAEAFGCEPGDPMVRSDEVRAEIW